MRIACLCVSVVVLAACGGSSSGDFGGRATRDAAASMVAAPVYADCSSEEGPRIDGVLAPGEWDRAVKVRFGAWLPGGDFVPAEVRAMSDDKNLYVAFRLGARADEFAQSHFVEIDADDSGAFSSGDDAFGFSFDPVSKWTQFFDDHRTLCEVGGQEILCAPGDTDGTPPGTDDGGAAIGFGEGETVIEEWHPYTGQDPYDVARTVGESLAMNFSIRLIGRCGGADCFGDTTFPPLGSVDHFRPIVLGCGAPAPEREVVELQVLGGPEEALPVIHPAVLGIITAVVLGSERFDASRIDPASVWLSGAPVVLRDAAHAARFEDVNGDEITDFVAEFAIRSLQLDATTEEVSIAGRTVEGLAFHGTDGVQVVEP
jgi:hypothetical protein